MSKLAIGRPRFSASVTFLYHGRSAAAVASHASEAGFSAVEFQLTEGGQAEEFAPQLQAAELPVALLNLDIGDFPAGGLGLAGVPGLQAQFMTALERGFREAKVLGAKAVHLGPSRVPPGVSREQCLMQLRENLQRARDRLGELAIPVSLEALNSLENPDVLLDNPEEIVDLMETLGSDGLGLQYDIYHAAVSSRDIAKDIGRFAHRLVHVQFADHPGRHEPGSGSVPLATYFELLSEVGYQGYLGAEYKPTHTLNESLGWIRPYSAQRTSCTT